MLCYNRNIRKSSISGFLELLPQERAVEQILLKEIQTAFKLFGFLEIENRAVEPVSALLAKGETSKEVYLLSRLQEAYEGDGALNWQEKLKSSKQLGLHFDLTVPFARYVVENAGLLQFPFRRTSIGKVWRGERPQAGRFREFTQADVDIVARQENGLSPEEALPLFNDIEIVKTVDFALKALEKHGVPTAKIHVNNRKLLQGCYEALNVKSFSSTLQTLDKLDKIGEEEVLKQLRELDEDADVAKQCVNLAQIKAKTAADLQRSPQLKELTLKSALAQEGLTELSQLLEATNAQFNEKRIVADLRITRGLDYYTGSVFETFLLGHENFGSIASGGRYNNLASSLQNNSKIGYPGVGMSIGVTRLLSIILDNDKMTRNDFSHAEVMVVVNSEEERSVAEKTADNLRAQGVITIISPTASKYGKQIDFAAKRGINHVLFIENSLYQLKNIVTGGQKAIQLDKIKDALRN